MDQPSASHDAAPGHLPRSGAKPAPAVLTPRPISRIGFDSGSGRSGIAPDHLVGYGSGFDGSGRVGEAPGRTSPLS